jgi:hypothetical protein
MIMLFILGLLNKLFKKEKTIVTKPVPVISEPVSMIVLAILGDFLRFTREVRPETDEYPKTIILTDTMLNFAISYEEVKYQRTIHMKSVGNVIREYKKYIPNAEVDTSSWLTEDEIKLIELNYSISSKAFLAKKNARLREEAIETYKQDTSWMDQEDPDF